MNQRGTHQDLLRSGSVKPEGDILEGKSVLDLAESGEDPVGGLVQA